MTTASETTAARNAALAGSPLCIDAEGLHRLATDLRELYQCPGLSRWVQDSCVDLSRRALVPSFAEGWLRARGWKNFTASTHYDTDIVRLTFVFDDPADARRSLIWVERFVALIDAPKVQACVFERPGTRNGVTEDYIPIAARVEENDWRYQ